jgi:hypothetical protein
VRPGPCTSMYVLHNNAHATAHLVTTYFLQDNCAPDCNIKEVNMCFGRYVNGGTG